MKILRALIDIVRLAIPEKIIAYRNILSKLTGNQFFPTPYIPLADVAVVVNALETAYIEAQDGSHTANSIMHDKELIADNDIRVLAHYVNQMSNGEETKLLSSGFNISKDVPPIAKPILSVVDGPHSGSAMAITTALDGSGVHVWQIHKGGIPALETDWETVKMTPLASILLDDLEVGTYVAVRVSSVTVKGTSEYCIPVVKLIN